MAKYLCWKCKVNTAEWVYMPGYAGKVQGEEYFCDDCISSPEDNGCSCNWHYAGIGASAECQWEVTQPKGVQGVNWRWIDENEKSWINLDEKGRPFPCCEFDYEKGGFDIERKLELTEEQISELKKLPNPEKWYISINIHLKDGRILDEMWSTDSTYIYVLEEDSITNGDILKFTVKI